MARGPGVVIGRSGSLGGGQYIVEDFWPLNTTLWVKDFKGNDRRFCYYLLKSLDLAQFNAGSGVPTLNRNHIHPLPIRIPSSVAEQRAIAGILGSLDDKIELNRRMNETLEAIAQALFKSWFVDFDPVRAKAEKHFLALPDLFPPGLVASEIAAIPEGWDTEPFSDTVDILGGGTPKTSVPDFWEGDIPWFAVGDTPKAGDVFVIDTAKRITRKGLENSAAQILPIGTTIISARGTVGNLALVGTPMAMNQSCYALRGRRGLGDYLTYFATKNLVSVLKQRTHGSVFDTITRDTFKTLRVVCPPAKVAGAFEGAVRPLMQRIRSNLREGRVLASARDLLLPKLLSGELRIDMAEKLVESTA